MRRLAISAAALLGATGCATVAVDAQNRNRQDIFEYAVMHTRFCTSDVFMELMAEPPTEAGAEQQALPQDERGGSCEFYRNYEFGTLTGLDDDGRLPPQMPVPVPLDAPLSIVAHTGDRDGLRINRYTVFASTEAGVCAVEYRLQNDDSMQPVKVSAWRAADRTWQEYPDIASLQGTDLQCTGLIALAAPIIAHPTYRGFVEFSSHINANPSLVQGRVEISAPRMR